MGNDGGSIPKRRELVKEAARSQTSSEVKETLLEQQEYCWTTCPLSQQPLKEPVVSDWGGNIYNKDAVIEYLLPADDEAAESAKLDKAKLLDGRIKTLKDVQEVKFHVDRSEESRSRTGAHFERRWSCPVTSKSLGPGVKAVYLIPCGHAFEEAAIRNVSEKRCLQCEEPFEEENVITVLPLTSSERNKLVARAQRLKERGLTHTLKKISGKKRKKGTIETEAEAAEIIESRQDKMNNLVTPNPGKSISTASLSAKVQAELDEKAKRRKLVQNDNIKGLYSDSGKQQIRDGDFMTRGFTMARSSRS